MFQLGLYNSKKYLWFQISRHTFIVTKPQNVWLDTHQISKILRECLPDNIWRKQPLITISAKNQSYCTLTNLSSIIFYTAENFFFYIIFNDSFYTLGGINSRFIINQDDILCIIAYWLWFCRLQNVLCTPQKLNWWEEGGCGCCTTPLDSKMPKSNPPKVQE